MQEQPTNVASQLPPKPKHKRLLIVLIIATVVIIAGGAGAAYYFTRPSNTGTGGTKQPVIQSHHTYSLNLMEGMAYKANTPTELMFDIRDENNNVLKDFDTVHTKLMHLIVVRKDRTNFQHVHPNFDQTTGMFAITGFQFPTNGEYRVFADFTASDAQKDEMAMKLASTPFKDVKVGDGTYTQQPLGADKNTSNVGGLTTSLSLLEGDSPNPIAYAGLPLPLAVNIDKDGVAYKNLQPYLGAWGHMVVLGPNLEFIHAHPLDDVKLPQTGMITFTVTFPVAGQYKIYLQTQANDVVNTSDFVFTTVPSPASTSKGSDQSMSGMDMH